MADGFMSFLEGIGDVRQAVTRGTRDPYGLQQARARSAQQNVMSNDMALAGQRLNIYAQMAIQGMETGQYDSPDEMYSHLDMLMESDDILKASPIQGNHAKAFVQFQRKQAQQAQAQAQTLAERDAYKFNRGQVEDRQANLKWLGEQVAGSSDVPKTFWDNVAPQIWSAAGQTNPTMGATAMQQGQPDPKSVTYRNIYNPLTKETRSISSTQPTPQGWVEVGDYQEPGVQAGFWNDSAGNVYTATKSGQLMNLDGEIVDPSTVTGSLTKASSARTSVEVGGPTINNVPMEKSTKGDIERDIKDAMVTISGLEDSINEFDSAYLTIPGKMLSGVQRMGDLMGVPEIAGTEHMQKQKAFVSGSMSEFLKFRKFITGVAGGIEEFKMIAKAFPNAEKDSPAEWMTKAKEAIANSKRVVNFLAQMRVQGIPINKENVEAQLSHIGGIENAPVVDEQSGPLTPEEQAELDALLKEAGQ